MLHCITDRNFRQISPHFRGLRPKNVLAEYLQYNKNEGVNEWAGGEAEPKNHQKCHEIKRNSTLTSKISLENAKEIFTAIRNH